MIIPLVSFYNPGKNQKNMFSGVQKETNGKEWVSCVLFLQIFQKLPLGLFCKKRCSKKFRKIRGKTPVPESLF